MDSSVLLPYVGLAASRILLQQLLACLNFTLDSQDLFCWYKWKKWFLWTMAAAQAVENHGYEWGSMDLILTMRDIYINSNLNPLPKFTGSSRSTELKDILPWNISQMNPKTIPFSMRIVISYAMKQGILFWVWRKVNGNWDNNMMRLSQWRVSNCRTDTIIRRNKSKRSGLCESQWEIQVGKLIIWVRSFEIKDYNRVHQAYQLHQNRLASSYDGCWSLQRQTH